MSENEKNQIVDINNQIANKDVLPPDIEQRIDEAKRQNTALMAMMDNLLEEGIDYGREKGIPKPFLHQPGAQQLGLVFKFRPEFEILDKTVDFDREPVFISYDVKCKLFQRDSGLFLGEGVGSCNNYERKYRYYRDGVEYDDPLDRANTYLKMAKKRAHVDATLNVTGATRLFTQDQDMVNNSSNYNNNYNKNNNKKVEVADDPGEYEIPFGSSKGDKLKDASESTLKWASNLNPTNDIGRELKQNAIKYMEMKNNDTSSDNKLSDRQKEIITLVGDDENMKKDVFDFLDFNEVSKVDDLNNEQYEELKETLNQVKKDDVDFEIDEDDFENF